jgi:hypothetical protein
MAAGKAGEAAKAAAEKGARIAEARGDLYAAGSGALEKKGERYRPERIPFGLSQARETKTGRARELGPTETPKAGLDALHKVELERARVEMKDMLARKVPAFVVQHYASDVVDLLLKQFHVEALQEMQAAGWGTPPTEYAFLALGSGGRQEHTSFGDLDLALVVGNTKTKTAGARTSKQYFQELGKRMADKANGLGERGHAAQGGKQKKGLRICEGGVFPAPSGQMPYGPEVLIGTPDDIAKVQRRPGFVTVGNMDWDLGADAELFDALREPRYAFGSEGGEALAKSYETKLSSTLAEAGQSGRSRSLDAGRVAIAEATKQADKLPKDVQFDGADFELNVKQLSRPVQLYIKGMCLCVGVTVANTRARVKALEKGGSLDRATHDKVSTAVDTIAGWRLHAHLEAMEQDDVVVANPSAAVDKFTLSDEERFKAKAIVSTVIPALRRSAEALVR